MYTSKEVKEIIDTHYGFDISTSSRKQERAFARMVYCKLARQYTNESLAQIGKSVNRHHSSICYCLKEVNNVISYYINVESNYIELDALLRKKGGRTLNDKYRDAMANAMYYRKKYFDIKK
jgi:chromosomal replication initiation ATPase DnaA